MKSPVSGFTTRPSHDTRPLLSEGETTKHLKFNADMLRLVEAGLKTQTRRPVLSKYGREVFPYGIPGDIVRVPGSDFKAKIISVDVERLQEISDSDVLSEGVPFPDDGEAYDREQIKTTFSRMWNSIYAAKGFGWDENPWVWVIEFEAVKP